MFKLRGCQKCHGDLFLGEDIYGAYFSCVQCGRYYAVSAESVRDDGLEPAAPAAGPPVAVDLELAA